MASDKPLKILHLTTHLNIGGITSYLSIVGGGMVKRGHEVTVVSSGGNSEEALRQKGIHIQNLPIRTKSELSPRLWSAAPKLIEMVRKEKFDLIHAHTRITQVLAKWVSHKTKVPVLTTAHGYYKPRLGRRLFGCWGERVVAISPLVAEELRKSHGVPAGKIRVIFNAIDILEFKKRMVEKNPEEIRRVLGIDPKAFVIGSISRLVRDKGHEYLIEAAHKLAKKYPDIYLLIVGDGREKRRLEKLVQRDGLLECSKLMPSEPDITGILSVLDVFVQPATFREGFGLTLIEAMAAKIPVVATNIWAINSMIRNRVNGFLVEPKNANELAQELDYVKNNNEAAGAIAQNGYEMACQLYAADRMVNELETVYREVVK